MRIRTIKPEFWTSITIARLPFTARLTFIGLWNYVDDEGRGVDDGRLIKAALWPLDDVISPDTIEQFMVFLAVEGLIDRYEVGGLRYFSVTSWSEHQSISKPRPSKLPEPSSGTPTLGKEPSSREGNGREGKGTGKGKEKTPVVADLSTEELAAASPRADIPATDQAFLLGRLRGRFESFSETNLTAGAVAKLNRDWTAAIVTSCLRELWGFPPDEIRDAFAYLQSMCRDRALEATSA